MLHISYETDAKKSSNDHPISDRYSKNILFVGTPTMSNLSQGLDKGHSPAFCAINNFDQRNKKDRRMIDSLKIISLSVILVI